jgi:hypothetical protein
MSIGFVHFLEGSHQVRVLLLQDLMFPSIFFPAVLPTDRLVSCFLHFLQVLHASAVLTAQPAYYLLQLFDLGG